MCKSARQQRGWVFFCSPCRVSLRRHLQQGFLKFPRLLHQDQEVDLEGHLVAPSTSSPEGQVTDTIFLHETWRGKFWLFWSYMGAASNLMLSLSCRWLCVFPASALWLLSQPYRDMGIAVRAPGALFSDSKRLLSQQT